MSIDKRLLQNVNKNKSIVLKVIIYEIVAPKVIRNKIIIAPEFSKHNIIALNCHKSINHCSNSQYKTRMLLESFVEHKINVLNSMSIEILL